MNIFEYSMMEGDKSQIEKVAKRLDFFLENGYDLNTDEDEGEDWK